MSAEILMNHFNKVLHVLLYYWNDKFFLDLQYFKGIFSDSNSIF